MQKYIYGNNSRGMVSSEIDPQLDHENKCPIWAIHKLRNPDNFDPLSLYPGVKLRENPFWITYFMNSPIARENPGLNNRIK